MGVSSRPTMADEDDFEEHRGKLRGRILLLDGEHDAPQPERPDFRRYSTEELEELTEFPVSPDHDAADNRARSRFSTPTRSSEAFRESVDSACWTSSIDGVGNV